ncbi:MAG: N-6 DNA methylase [Chitinophagaceae bacterium]|nr:N-6 DNA methylase [Anaerolineae bacterium]
MQSLTNIQSDRRYKIVTDEKADGATYTPPHLATFVASQIVESANLSNTELHILDPAVGDGELLLSLVAKILGRSDAAIVVHGFDTNPAALAIAQQRIETAFPNVDLRLQVKSFLEFVTENNFTGEPLSLFSSLDEPLLFDLIIANPPYVRTQIMGANQAQKLAAGFELNGRVDLYHAFLIAMAQVLKPTGTAGIIVSNRFMTTKSGASLRTALRTRLGLRHVWDLGDTKLFDAAVLPAVILADGHNGHVLPTPGFTSIYETEEPPTLEAADPIDALTMTGNVGVKNGRCFRVQHGTLNNSGPNDDVWRIATTQTDIWLSTVLNHTWRTFGDIGKIRVGVKTCADKIFIRSDWHELPENERPELLRTLTTHHIARRFRSISPKKRREILYPHESINGQRRAVNLSEKPKSLAYLESHRAVLEARTYVMKGGRRWYELWVPQDPTAWDAPKLVFRDISERPTFWMDLEGSVVNGDCYWMTTEKGNPEEEELLWLAAAVANSKFIETFYDHRFNNKLYAGRRRFMTQYVEQFPLPDPETTLTRKIVKMTKEIYANVNERPTADIEARLDALIWQAFGLSVEEVTR